MRQRWTATTNLDTATDPSPRVLQPLWPVTWTNVDGAVLHKHITH